MKRFATGLICGLLLGFGAGLVLLLISLPAPPSSSHSLFPIATTALPAEATQSLDANHIGFDLYRNPKARAILDKNKAIPTKCSSSWLASPGHDGTLHVNETIWAEYDGKLYQIAHFEKKYRTEPNKHMDMLKVLQIEANRTFTIRVLLPEIEVDETFGPFELPRGQSSKD